MRLTTWNCAGRADIRKFLSLAEPLDADLVTLQECQQPRPNEPSVIWRGQYPGWGTAVISRRTHLELKPLDIPSLHHSVVPVKIQGPEPFLFVGVWTHPDYIKVAKDSMMACMEAADGLPVVAAGDFNISPAVQPKQAQPFLQWMQEEHGLVSAYHHCLGVAPGEETHHTYYHHRKEPQPFHIDYCFVPESWRSRLSGVTIGSYDGWPQSDHRPLTVEVRDL